MPPPAKSNRLNCPLLNLMHYVDHSARVLPSAWNRCLLTKRFNEINLLDLLLFHTVMHLQLHFGLSILLILNLFLSTNK